MNGHLILAALVLAVVVIVVLLASPIRTCARCKGERVARHWLTGKLGTCRRCGGTGQHYRRGAVLVHRAKWTLRRAIAAELQQRRQPTQDAQPATADERKDTTDVM